MDNGEAKHDPSYLSALIGQRENMDPNHICLVNSQVRGIDLTNISETLKRNHNFNFSGLWITYDQTCETYPEVEIVYRLLKRISLEDPELPPDDFQDDVKKGLEELGLGGLIRMYHVSEV